MVPITAEGAAQEQWELHGLQAMDISTTMAELDSPMVVEVEQVDMKGQAGTAGARVMLDRTRRQVC